MAKEFPDVRFGAQKQTYAAPHGLLNRHQWTLFSFRQRDRNCVPNPNLTARDDDRHDPGLADQVAVGIVPEHGLEQTGLKRLDLPAGIAQAGDLDQGLGAKAKPRSRWQCQQVDAAGSHVFSDRARPQVEPAGVKLLEQLLVDEMHLPQIRNMTEFPDVRAVLHRFAHVRIASDAKTGDEENRRLVGLGERVLLAAAHRRDNGGPVVAPAYTRSKSAALPAKIFNLSSA